MDLASSRQTAEGSYVNAEVGGDQSAGTTRPLST